MTNMSVYQLERTRKGVGVSLEAISEKTKICTRYLRAIESEEFEKLPGGVFSTSYIRQYAKAIGFAEDQLLKLYAERRWESETPEPVQVQPPSRTLIRTCVDWLLRPAAAR